ncbi:MAG: hypothetical protein HYV09_21020 [Deltaproteobacteria bacterium]|nr:hypothetical protein [Deltaproteobacteria bacterium]
MAVGSSGLALLTIGARTASTPTTQAAPIANADEAAAHVASPAVVAFLGDIAPGAKLGDYEVVAVEPMHRGGIPIKMRASSGVAFVADVLRHDPADDTRAIGETSAVAVYLRNGGDGATSTDEIAGLGAMTLASALRRRVHEGATLPVELLTMSERAHLA